MGEKYTYLFPYEKIPYGSKILIYGAGDVGQEYLQQMMITKYCDVIGFADRLFDKYPPMIVPLYSPDEAIKLNYDYIVLAFKMGIYAAEIRRVLLAQGISEQKIVYQGARNSPPSILCASYANPPDYDSLAFDVAPLSIALKLGSALGDAIIRKRLVVEIMKMAPEAKFDIYVPGGGGLIQSFYSDLPQVNRIIEDGGVLYATNHKKYGISMSIFFMIQVDHMDYQEIKKINPMFADQMQKHVENHAKYTLHTYPTTQNAIHFARAFYKGWNCYNLYNYTGVFNISDMNVNIPLDQSFERNFEKMHLGKYITLSYGNNSTQKGNKEKVTKQWPKEYFDQFANMFRQKYPKISIIQVGDNTTENIQHVNRRIIGKSIELVKYILKNAIFHLDIEGGLMHLATQLGTKCVTLLGPTQANLFSYPQNINIVSSQCKDCYCLYDNPFKCARDLEKPECMWSIAPEMVIERVEKEWGKENYGRR